MFPRLRQQLLARVDLLVEFSTLGEYGIDEHGSLMELEPEPTPVRLAPRVRDRCGDAAHRGRFAEGLKDAGRGAPVRF